ncbi:MAG: hypothetical protein IKH78_00640 [Ruminococcus sp.]|nr:hypothetical protein [Ruminococcus sp.]
MSSVTAFTHREALPVTIGSCVIYCEEFRASAARSINEEPTADGGTALTNDSLRSTRLTFSGRICTEDDPMDFVYDFNSLIRSGTALAVEYMGLRFTGCRMLAYTYEDKGGDWASATVTLITAEAVTRSVSP